MGLSEWMDKRANVCSYTDQPQFPKSPRALSLSTFLPHQFNVTAAKLVPDIKVAKLTNTTTAAVVGLKNFTQGIILDKEAKIEEALKADIWAAPKAVPAKPAVTDSFARAADHTSDEAGKQVAGCRDEAPKDSRQFSCDQQKSWGKCGEGWMTSEGAPKKGWCAKTCGRC
jgi:hypothetical protein